MTDFRVTQASLEQWGVGTPAMNTTQAAVEMWASVATLPSGQMVVTQCGVEMWASVAQAARGGPRVSIIV
jgi:hypothetical protein